MTTRSYYAIPSRDTDNSGHEPALVTVPNGNLYAIVQDHTPHTNPPDTTWYLDVWKSTDDGQTWSMLSGQTQTPTQILGSAVALGYPSATADSQGYIHVAVTGYGATRGIAYRRFNTSTDEWVDSWADPISGAHLTWDASSIIVDENDKPHLVFADTTKVYYTNKVSGVWSNYETVDTPSLGPTWKVAIHQVSTDVFIVRWWIAAGDYEYKYRVRTSGSWGDITTGPVAETLGNPGFAAIGSDTIMTYQYNANPNNPAIIYDEDGEIQGAQTYIPYAYGNFFVAVKDGLYYLVYPHHSGSYPWTPVIHYRVKEPGGNWSAESPNCLDPEGLAGGITWYWTMGEHQPTYATNAHCLFIRGLAFYYWRLEAGYLDDSKSAYMNGDYRLEVSWVTVASHDPKPAETSFISAYIYPDADTSSVKHAYLAGGIIATPSSVHCYFLGQGELLLPNGDVTVNDWVNEDSEAILYPSINEVNPDDNTYVTKTSVQVNDYFEVACSDLPAGYVGTGDQYIEIRGWSVLGNITLELSLRKGAQVIASREQTFNVTSQTYSFQLTPQEIDAIIDDYNSLTIRVTVTEIT